MMKKQAKNYWNNHLDAIRTTFQIIPDSLFENKITEKSIYINIESLGYEHDWSGKEFLKKNGNIIPHFEIKHFEIKNTKQETLNYFIKKEESQTKILKLAATKRKQIED